MALDKYQLESISFDLTLLSNWQVVDFIDGEKYGFGSRLQQARDLRKVVKGRYAIVRSLGKTREANLISDSILSLDQAIRSLEAAEEESVD